MKATLRIFDIEIKRHVSPHTDEDLANELMAQAGLVIGLGFEDFGIQSDGQLVVFDKCGNFGYLNLDPEKYNVHVQIALDGKPESIKAEISRLQFPVVSAADI